MPTKKPAGLGSSVQIFEGAPRRRFASLGEPDLEEAPNFDPEGPLGQRIIYDPSEYPRDPTRLRPALPIAAPFVHLSSQVVVPPGQQLSPPLRALMVPSSQAHFIDKIKIEVAALAADNGSATLTYATQVGSVIAVQFKVGDIELTNGFVPVSLFGPVLRTAAEVQAGTNQCINDYEWEPRSPIYIPPGACLEPVFENRGFLSANLRVRVSYLARPVGVAPQGALAYPYVMSWQSQTIPLSGTQVEVESTEKDLLNASGESLLVECIVGRLVEVFNLSSATIPTSLVEGQAPGASDRYDVALQQTRCQLTSSWGTRVIRDWIPWPAAFDRFSRSLPGLHEMPKDGFYTMGVRSGTTANSAGQASVFAAVSVIGSREVSP